VGIGVASLVVFLAAAPAAAQNSAPPAPAATPTPAASPTGDTAQAPVPKAHEDVVVTAERGPEPLAEIPASVSVLKSDQIRLLPAQDLSELLQFLPGFHALFRESFGGPPPIVTSRGFFGGGEAEYVQLRVDGVPVGDVESGLADWRRIRAADVERIEALRGPASSLYGDTALGGVIQVFTRTAELRGSSASISASGGSFGTAAADLGWDFGGDALSGGVGGTYFRTDGYREHNGEESGILRLSTSTALAGGRLSFDAAGSRDLRDDPGSLDGTQYADDDRQSDPLYRFDHTDTDRGRIGLSYRRDDGAVPFLATVYGGAREAGILRTLLVAPGFGNRTFRDLHSGTFGGTLQGEKSFRLFGLETLWRAGGEASHETLRTNYRFVDDDGARGPIVSREEGDRDRFAFYFTGDLRVTERVRLSGGVRWDRIADDFHVEAKETPRDAWSPRIGLNVRVGDLAGAPVALYVQASKSFKAPTLDQLFDPHPFQDFEGNTFSISNPNLVPQEAKNLEVGISQQGRVVQWDALAYRMTVDNEIDFNPATFSYQNIGASLHRGVETTVRFAAGPDLSPFVSYGWSRVESRTGEHEGKQLKNIPEHLVRAGLVAKLPAGFEASAIWTWMGRRWLDDDNVYPLEDASVVDLRLAKSFGSLRARLDLSNLTNTKYSQYGFALFDFFSGANVPYYYPGARFAARFGIDWRN
jgi:outer membrane receptor protein involved in Fe transport